jgi:hypothetical protein
MKKIHYRNIGFPKTGTNWLWQQLGTHPQIDGRFNDVSYKEYRTVDLVSYIKVYEKYDITYNMDVNVFQQHDPDHYLRPENIHHHTTHITMFLRNPYEVLNSMYNMEKNRNPNFNVSKEMYINISSPIVKRYSDIQEIFDYWENSIIPVKYMFYDDLVENPKQFMFDICEHIGLKSFYNDKKKKVFVTEKNDPLVFDNQTSIDYINKNISVVEDTFKRDLSHWKK